MSVTWHSRVTDTEDVARLLLIADVAVLPFESGVGENNGSFAAYTELGVPTVTTRGQRSGPVEALEVAVFADHDWVAIANAVARLVADDASRQALSKRARAWAERSSWENTARSYVRIFEEVLS